MQSNDSPVKYLAYFSGVHSIKFQKTANFTPLNAFMLLFNWGVFNWGGV